MALRITLNLSQVLVEYQTNDLRPIEEKLSGPSDLGKKDWITFWTISYICTEERIQRQRDMVLKRFKVVRRMMCCGYC